MATATRSAIFFGRGKRQRPLPEPSGAVSSPNMIPALKWIMGVLGLLLLMASPYAWKANPMLLWLIIPLLCGWAFWLMMEYLRWARSLGKK